jgi:hypothetical protein
MPGFNFDAQGPEISFKVPEGVVEVVNNLVFGFTQNKSLRAACGVAARMALVLHRNLPVRRTVRALCF